MNRIGHLDPTEFKVPFTADTHRMNVGHALPSKHPGDFGGRNHFGAGPFGDAGRIADVIAMRMRYQDVLYVNILSFGNFPGVAGQPRIDDESGLSMCQYESRLTIESEGCRGLGPVEQRIRRRLCQRNAQCQTKDNHE